MKYQKHKSVVEGILETISEYDGAKNPYTVTRDEDDEIELSREREAGAPIDSSALDIRIITILNAIGYSCSVYDGKIQVGGSADE